MMPWAIIIAAFLIFASTFISVAVFYDIATRYLKVIEKFFSDTEE